MLDLLQLHAEIRGIFMHIDSGSWCNPSGTGACGPPQTSMQHCPGVHVGMSCELMQGINASTSN